MDSSSNKQPSKITDTTELVCNKCDQLSYTEIVTTNLCDNGLLKYERFVTGSFKQECDKAGIPTGPIIPTCNCKREK